MPVTANFSEAFYERLGHDIVEELVAFLNRIDTSYKVELRELNELNYQRFDAMVGQRFAQADLKLEQRIGELRAGIIESRAVLHSDIAALRGELHGEIGTSRGELRSTLAQMESKLIRWMFVFWAGSTLTILGTMVALLRT